METWCKRSERGRPYLLSPEWVREVWTTKEDRKEWMSQPDHWVKLSAGAYSPTKDPPPLHYLAMPIKYPQIDKTCLASSFASALHMAGDESTAANIIKQIGSLRQGAHLYQKFVNLVNNARPRNQNGDILHLEKTSTYDIIKGPSPAAVILQGMDSSVTHAIAVFDQYLIDASWQYALPRTIESLNWCCAPSTYYAPDIVYVLKPGKNLKKRKRRRIV